MEYRVEQLADLAGVRVDTIRFYQGKGLLPAPERRGRVAIYGEAHLERVGWIRGLLDEGFSLAQIGRLLDREASQADRSRGDEDLLTALVEERVGERSLTRAELASEAGVPDALIAAVVGSGLMEPVRVDGEDRFSEADVEMARTAITILGLGFPLDELINLSVDHARQVQALTDRGIDLFDDHVRKRPGASSEETSQAFRALLPQVTRLVALHFQRTLVHRALERLSSGGEEDALRQALAATDSLRLEVSWR